MRGVAIRVNDLSKKFRIEQVRRRHDTLRDRLSDGVMSLRRRDGRQGRGDGTFWALRNVTFEVEEGGVLGVVGRNGAGKTTLLKILSRITAPTSGRAEIHGRVGSLLEVGTGFHQELTGRENIYLNGAILGMRRREIDRKFDEIVDFAEVEKFIDTPVKRYSSGMFVRLAFAVAAHLEPEILFIDEVLAVGDVRFQQKCFRRMREVGESGRTVLFVSHNMTAVANLCRRGILLDNGRIVLDGDIADVLDRYLSSHNRRENLFLSPNGDRRDDYRARIVNFEVIPQQPRTGMPAQFVFTIDRPETQTGELPGNLGILVYTEEGTRLMRLFSNDMAAVPEITAGRVQISASVESLPLAPGRYRLDLWLGLGRGSDQVLRDCFVLSVGPGRVEGGSIVTSANFPVIIPSRWTRLE